MYLFLISVSEKHRTTFIMAEDDVNFDLTAKKKKKKKKTPFDPDGMEAGEVCIYQG